MHAGTAVDANYFKIVSTSRFNVISDRTADRLSYSVDDKCARCYAIDTSTSISELSHAVDNQNLDRHVKNDPNKIDFDDKSKIISITDTDHAKMSISINDKLAAHGCSILRNALSIEVLGVTRKALQPILKNLQQRYDQIADEFEGLEKHSVQEALGITRCPRIGKGKHNIHFDPYQSDEHRVLVDMIDDAKITKLLSAYSKKICTVRETGFSMTRPCGIDGIEGEGMEWHSDGAEGEFTMLMSLTDVSLEMGSLGVIPASHLQFKEGTGHGDISNKDFSHEEIRYAYRGGQPIIIDARTLHNVSKNQTNHWRIVIWLILDTY